MPADQSSTPSAEEEQGMAFVVLPVWVHRLVAPVLQFFTPRSKPDFCHVNHQSTFLAGTDGACAQYCTCSLTRAGTIQVELRV